MPSMNTSVVPVPFNEIVAEVTVTSVAVSMGAGVGDGPGVGDGDGAGDGVGDGVGEGEGDGDGDGVGDGPGVGDGVGAVAVIVPLTAGMGPPPGAVIWLEWAVTVKLPPLVSKTRLCVPAARTCQEMVATFTLPVGPGGWLLTAAKPTKPTSLALAGKAAETFSEKKLGK